MNYQLKKPILQEHFVVGELYVFADKNDKEGKLNSTLLCYKTTKEMVSFIELESLKHYNFNQKVFDNSINRRRATFIVLRII